jgi:CheY-like chemotaxis protein
LRVLIVDDVEELRRLLRLILEAETGMEVLEAASAEEALEIAAREHVDLVVMDHVMPGMSGLECIRRLRAATPGMECVAFTSSPDAEATFLAAGATRHFTKPEVDPLLAFLHQRALERGRGHYRVAE